MNTLKWLPGLIALVLGHLAPSPLMAASQHAAGTLVVMGAVGQTAGSKTDDRKAVVSLMAQAREAIQAGDLKTADSLITQAEQLNVSFSVLHFGDTPKKLRAKLSAARRDTKRGRLKRPSQRFDPQLPDPDAEPSAARPSRSNDGRMPTATLNTDDPAMKNVQQRVLSSAQYLSTNMARVPAMLIPCTSGRLD
ncbi:MAG: hypothetical protein IH985_02885, partial [Planctomycetes bacterium]|nr:hypothetical protein [Planctomycetota bacterium]